MKSPTVQQRPGVVLLLGLLLMAAIVASTIAIATAVSSSSHQSKNLDDFVVASLGADSGLERGLSIIKTGRTIGNTILASTTASSATSQAVVASSSAGSNLSVSSVPTSADITIPDLRPFESVTFDFLGYSTFGYLGNLLNNGSSTISIAATDPGCTTPDVNQYPCNGKLEVDWIGLDSGGVPSFSGRQTYTPDRLTGASIPLNLFDAALIHLPESDTAPVSNLSTTKGFRITVRALDVLPHAPLTDAQAIDRATIHNIRVTPPAPLNTCSGTCPTGVVTLTSTGSAGTSQSVKQASILWQLPASQLFNFVLFSEGNIIPN